MKKILAILLAVCLTLSLGVVAFASDNSGAVDPSGAVTPGTPDINNPEIGKLVSSATAADGSRVDATIDPLPSNDPISQEEEVKDSSIQIYETSVGTNVPDSTEITYNAYCNDADEYTADQLAVAVRDDWELLEGANLQVSGNRVTFTVKAGVIRQWKYFAIVVRDKFNTVDVENPAEGTDNEGDTEGDDTMNAGDTDETPAEGEDTTPVEPETTAPAEQNPPTGVVLAVVPMIVAAAAIVISKKR